MRKNEDRARRAALAIKAYIQDDDVFSLDRAEVLADLLCDLRHWAAFRGVNFKEANTRAAGHFEVETSDRRTI